MIFNSIEVHCIFCSSEINTDNIIWCLDLILFYRIDLLASFMYEKYFFKIK